MAYLLNGMLNDVLQSSVFSFASFFGLDPCSLDCFRTHVFIFSFK